MRKLFSFVHISLDGFVAGPAGEMDWITINDEIFQHVEKRIAEGDTALYGRVTYEMMESYWPTAADRPTATRHDIEHAKWYKQSHKIVISRSMAGQSPANTTVISENLPGRIQQIKQEEGKDILVFGSPSTTHSLIQSDLIDGYWLFVNPVVLGKGIPLFPDITAKIKLKLLGVRQFECGVTELSYEVNRP